MSEPRSIFPVVICGGGPVGLFLAIALQKKGVRCQVLERRSEPITHSRSLGIHPVALELFDQLEIAAGFLGEGVRIQRGFAFHDRGLLGTVRFSRGPGPHPYILSLPQFRTEALLEEQLRVLDPTCLIRGAELAGCLQTEDFVEVSFTRNGRQHRIRSEFLVGCDGKDSRVREAASFDWTGRSYPDTYLMGDFTDNTTFGNDAAVFLCREGLVESFPVQDHLRRWVVKTDRYLENPQRDQLVDMVTARLGHDLSREDHIMLSSFGVQRFLSRPLARGRIYLAGDAAQVVSPIGGQGMNLGWLEAWDLASRLERAPTAPSQRTAQAREYTRRFNRMARRVIRRAEWNMAIGRKRRHPGFRNSLLRLLLLPPFDRIMIRFFTLRGLSTWPV